MRDALRGQHPFVWRLPVNSEIPLAGLGAQWFFLTC